MAADDHDDDDDDDTVDPDKDEAQNKVLREGITRALDAMREAPADAKFELMISVVYRPKDPSTRGQFLAGEFVDSKNVKVTLTPADLEDVAALARFGSAVKFPKDLLQNIGTIASEPWFELAMKVMKGPCQGWVVAALSQGYIDDCSSLPEVLRDDYDELWRITNGFWNAESEEEQPIYLGRAGTMFEVPALRSIFTDKTVVQIYTFLLFPLKPPVEAGDDSLDEVDDAPTNSAKEKDYYEDQVVGIAQGRLMVDGVIKP